MLLPVDPLPSAGARPTTTGAEAGTGEKTKRRNGPQTAPLNSVINTFLNDSDVLWPPMSETQKEKRKGEEKKRKGTEKGYPLHCQMC